LRQKGEDPAHFDPFLAFVRMRKATLELPHQLLPSLDFFGHG